MTINPPNIQQNIFNIRNPTLKDLLDYHQRQIMLTFNAHHLATIQAFDEASQTVTASINYKKTYFKFIESTQVYEPYLVDYPLLLEVPVIILGGGSTHITFPITVGDQCLLLFNDRDIDNWFGGSTSSANSTPRLHAFADAIALIGPNNLIQDVGGTKKTKIDQYDKVRALITNQHAKIGINPTTNKITLQNDDNSLKTLLTNLCTQLQDLNTAIKAITVNPGTFSVTLVQGPGPADTVGPGNVLVLGISTVPNNQVAFTNISNQIGQISTQLAGLLE